MTINTLLGLCVGLYGAAAWADSAGSKTAKQSDETAGHAWSVNGMQVIEITPDQRLGVHVVRQPDGSLAIRHGKSAQAQPQ